MGALISESYRSLNAELHERRQDYGSNGHRWAPRVRELAELGGYQSILDYGCGKGGLGRAVENVREYDPAIAGKDTEPEPADLVICTDVLEHIEPDRIDAVLEHLARLTLRCLFFVIATGPAVKTLADGRNAHVLIRTPDWWRDRLAAHFRIEGFSATAGHIVGTGLAMRVVQDFVTFAAVPEPERNEHVRINVAKVGKRLKDAPAHDRSAVLVCYGPSLKQTWPVARFESVKRADLFTVSAAHAFMIERNVRPKAHIDCDPREHKGQQIGSPHPDIEYWLASCVHPSYVEKLKGYDVSLWHLWSGDGSAPIYDDIEPGAWLLAGGGSVGLRAIMLLYALGYREIAIHGMDCSFDDDGCYAGAHLGKPVNRFRVQCAGRWFDSSPILVTYARQFIEDMPKHPDLKLSLHGDGLLQQMLRASR